MYELTKSVFIANVLDSLALVDFKVAEQKIYNENLTEKLWPVIKTKIKIHADLGLAQLIVLRTTGLRFLISEYFLLSRQRNYNHLHFTDPQ